MKASYLPSFYIIIQVTDDGIATNAYLYHVWEEILGLVLNKFRNLNKHDWENLNYQYMQLPIGEAQKFEELHGRELRRLLKANIGESTTKYVEEKIELRNSIGYEDGQTEVNFRAKLPERYNGNVDEFLVDLALGLVDRAELDEFTIFDIRFNKPIEIEKNEGGYFEFKVEPEEQAILTLRTLDNRLATNVETNLYLPKGIANLVKKDEFKVLYQAPYINITLSPAKEELNLSYTVPELKEECELDDLEAFSELLIFANQASNEKIRLDIKHEEKPPIGFSLKFPLSIEEEIVKLSEAIQAALSLKNFLKLKEKITVTPSILFNQHESLKFLHTLMKPRNTQARLEFGIDEDLDRYEKTISLIPINIVLGDSIFAIQIGVHGKPEKIGKMAEDVIKYKLESTDVQIEQFRQAPRKNPELQVVHSELYQISIDKYDKEDIMVLHNKDNETK